MEKLSAFQVNDSSRLFQLAKELNQNKFFDTFLNENQVKIIDCILSKDDSELWTNFLEGNCVLKIDKEEQNGYLAEDGKVGDEIIEEGSAPMKVLALHIRYLLWEKAIDYYYTSDALNSSLYTIKEISDDFHLIDSMAENDEDGGDDGHKGQSTGSGKVDSGAKPGKPVREEEDDDYDDEDDEDEEAAKDADTEANDADAEQDPTMKVTQNKDRQVLIEIPLHIFESKKEPEPSEELEGTTTSEGSKGIEEQEKMIKEFNKVYHNFEYDRETLIKRRRLEKSDMQLENSEEPSSDMANGGGSGAGGSNSEIDANDSVGINLGAASHSLKHLINNIQQRRNEISLNDFELRTLFNDVRKNRGKWASDERVGQEELYDACEKVVLDLRGYTEHSTPFLNKVSKREAPNYGLIIKKPMDLNTVMKKLKNLLYNSKQEFVDDLMLIWLNCLTYNADPKHFLRAHAIAMQKRTLKLIPSIPNIVVRSRAEVEREEEVENDDKGTPAAAGKSSKKGRKRTKEGETKLDHDMNADSSEDTSTQTPAPPSSSADVKDETEESKPAETTEQSNDYEDDEMEVDLREENENGTNEVEDEVDLEMQTWKSLTAKSRAHYCAQRAALFDSENKLKPNAVAILRRSDEMNNFNHYLNTSEVVSKSSNLLENDEPYLLEYDIMGGLPGMKYKGVTQEEEERYEQKLVDTYLQQANGDANKIKSRFALPLDKGLNKVYFDNISEMQEIRKICFKISLIRQMQTRQFVHHTQMKQPEIDQLKEVDIDPASNLSNHDPYYHEVQFSVLRKNVAKIAMQTGFESSELFAINTLTQVAEKYLANLIKSIKLHVESSSKNTLTSREILLLSLLENGVDKPDDLYTYVTERILKQQDKLKDLRSKLANFLKELLRPGIENFNERSFEDSSEQFMTGDFSSDLGDDFFGFKELGLDKEYNMLSTSIPIFLLHSRLHNNYNAAGSASKRNKYEDLKDYSVKALFASDIDHQIGILHPFYNKILEKSKAHFIKLQKKKGESTALPDTTALVMIEDEELPQKQRNIRPRLPPTGKISSVKKKPISSAFILPDQDD